MTRRARGPRPPDPEDRPPPATRLTVGNIAARMLVRVPELEAARQLSTYGGELLVTIFLGNAAQYVLTETRALASAEKREQAAIRARIAGILELVEQALVEGDDRLQGAVSAAFIEELDTDAATFRMVVALLGPASQCEVTTLTRFYHSKEWRDFIARKK